ncbi:MAG: hypothetical protein LBT00_02545 [Spirochaetaceae bacterium]|nr:hypothetical protein [Spirochaetaceae bacterium]
MAAIVIARREATKQSSRGACPLDCHASLAMTGGPLAMTKGLPAMTSGELSLRGAKRRSNPDGEGFHAGLLRSARNDEGLARNDVGIVIAGHMAAIVIANREAAKQSRRRRPSPWIASLRSQ